MFFGWVVHLFVVYWYQGVEEDPDKLALSDKLPAAVPCELMFDAVGNQSFGLGISTPIPGSFIRFLKASLTVNGLIQRGLFAMGRGEDFPPPPSFLPTPLSPTTCLMNLDEGAGFRRDFAVVCPDALAGAASCSVVRDRRFTHHFEKNTEFSFSVFKKPTQARLMDSMSQSDSAVFLLPRSWMCGTSKSKKSRIFWRQSVYNCVQCAGGFVGQAKWHFGCVN